MVRVRLSGVGVALIMAAAAVWAGAPAGEGGRPGRVLYQLKPGASAAQLQALEARGKAHGLATVRTLQGLGVHVAQFALGKSTERDVCADLLATGAVAFAEPDALVPPVALPNDTYYNSQWQHARINSPGAWDRTTGSASVLAAVCDTGVSSTHPDLAANLQLPGYNAVDGSTNTEPVYNHGTGVAGCIGAVGNNGAGVAGMAWTVKILPIRITNASDGLAYVSDAANGIRYAADRGAKVVNLSYLMAGYSTIDAAAQYLRGKGGLLFVAAGNNGQDPGWPDFASFVAVGATDSADNKASWSNYGTYIDVVAPGVSVYSTTGASSYGSMSGTSFSSPIAAGLGALLYSVNPSATPAEVENVLFTTCQDLGAAGEDNVFGHGRIDAAAAVARMANVQPNRPPLAVAAASPTSGAAPLAVAFDGSSSTDADGAVVSYQWAFGDGASATGASPAHTYSAPGTYTATLTVTDNQGAADTDSVRITVDPDPTRIVFVKSIDMALRSVAGGTMALATVCIVDISGTPVPGATVNGSWSSPKASTAAGITGADGTVTLESLKAKGSPLTFTITVTGVSVSGYTYDPSLNLETTDSISTGSAVNQPPKAVAAATPTAGQAPLAVDLSGAGSSDPDGQITSYQWDFGDGTTGSGASVQHVYWSPGTYTATLTVTDNQGATGTAQVVIVVADGPVEIVCVKSIALRLVAQPGGTAIEATVSIVTGAGAPVTGAAVAGQWSGIVTGTATATTDAAGNATFLSRKTKSSGTATFTVTGVTHGGCVYDSTANGETSDSISK